MASGKKAAKKIPEPEQADFTTIPIEDLLPDDHNANKGTERGREMVRTSLQKLGAGRSVLLDKNNRIIAGNKTVEQARDSGFKRVMVIETDGKTLIAVRRKDLSLEQKKARELAVADNRASEVGLSWDVEVLPSLDLELTQFWDERELGLLLGDEPTDPNAEWKGMPAFDQENKQAFRTLYIHFKDQAAVDQFAEQMKLPVTEKTKFLWYPQIEIEHMMDKRYVSEPEVIDGEYLEVGEVREAGEETELGAEVHSES